LNKKESKELYYLY